MDIDEYSNASHDQWERSAGGWGEWAQRLQELVAPVSHWMIEELRLQPGQTVLELAAGPGETGFLAAELVRPGGKLISSDFAEGMVEVARSRAPELGLDNVEFRRLDAESLEIDAASVDGVLCRWGYMLMADPNTALRETRRVLKTGGRVALAAWASPDDNPWVSIPGRELVRRGLVEPVKPGEPGQFTWAPDGVIAEQLADAGFVEYEIDAVDFVDRYASFEDYWETQSSMSSRMRDALAGAGPAVVEDLREAVRAQVQPAGDGTIELPARTWVAVATA